MANCSDVRRELERLGLLLLQDKKLPSVVGIITGQRLSTSWWSHPRGQEIFNCLETIDHDAVATRLVAGKVTFVHRRLWPALVGAGKSRAKWRQTSRDAKPRELQEHLATFAEEIHTESGRHEMRLASWSEFARERGVRAVPASRALRQLEKAAIALGAPLTSLPWLRFKES
jgi:hypothetical protein